MPCGQADVKWENEWEKRKRPALSDKAAGPDPFLEVAVVEYRQGTERQLFVSKRKPLLYYKTRRVDLGVERRSSAFAFGTSCLSPNSIQNCPPTGYFNSALFTLPTVPAHASCSLPSVKTPAIINETKMRCS
jgi:hypothetical protein